MKFEEFKETYYEIKGFETVEEETENAPVHDGENWNTAFRKLLSDDGDISVLLEDAEKFANWNMQKGLLSNSRVTLKSVSNSQITKRILEKNGFELSECSELVVAFVPNDLDVMGKAKWVLSKYTSNSQVLEEIKTYDEVNHKTNVIGWGINVMDTDYGFKLVIGGKMGVKTYVAPYMLVKHLNTNNKLSNQVFNGYLLGLTDSEKEYLKKVRNSNYKGALRQNAYDLVVNEQIDGSVSVLNESDSNRWAFAVLDDYRHSNRDFRRNEVELEQLDFIECLNEEMELLDWRKSATELSDALISKLEHRMRDLVDFWNGESLISKIEDLEYSKSKFGDVKAELIKFGEYLLELEQEEDNSFSVGSALSDYYSNYGEEKAESRGYKKTYRHKELEEMAIAKSVITDFKYSEFYSNKKHAYELADFEFEIRESEKAHNKALELRFKENKTEQAYWDRIEAEYGVSGLTAFTPASVLLNERVNVLKMKIKELEDSIFFEKGFIDSVKFDMERHGLLDDFKDNEEVLEAKKNIKSLIAQIGYCKESIRKMKEK